MSTPLVSVVLPTYGRPEHLRRAAKSVNRQTYENIELVVVDDCSPTPAEQSLSPLDLENVETRIVRHEENRGANVARNTGIRTSEGTYVAFLDDDDEWKAQKIEKQVETFERAQTGVGLVYTGSVFRYGDHTQTVIYTNRGDVTEDILMGRRFGKFSTLMVERDVIERAGLPDPDLPSWQDWDWLLRLSQHCLFELVAEPLTIRWCKDDIDRIGDNFEEKRDVSYPRLLEKHVDLAGTYGWKYKRGFIAALTDEIGRSALRNGYYSDARKYLLKATYYYPFQRRRLIYTLVSLGGGYSYEPISRFVRALHRIGD